MTAEIIGFLLVMARVSVLVALFPLFARRQLPNLVKLGLATALSLFWTPAAVTELNTIDLPNISGPHFTVLVIEQMFIGFLLAMLMGLFFWPAKIAGAYIAQEVGLSLASISDPNSQDSSTLVSRIFEAFCILLFFALNMHHFMLLIIDLSFKRVMTHVGLMELPTEGWVQAYASCTDWGLLIIAPILVLLMLVTVILTFLIRAAPSLNLFSIGMPLRVGLGALLLCLFSPIVFAALEHYMYRAKEEIEYLLSSMMG